MKIHPTGIHLLTFVLWIVLALLGAGLLMKLTEPLTAAHPWLSLPLIGLLGIINFGGTFLVSVFLVAIVFKNKL
jgi:hypothetical protein